METLRSAAGYLHRYTEREKADGERRTTEKEIRLMIRNGSK